MHRPLIRFIVAAVAATFVRIGQAEAGSLRVAPVLIDLTAPASAATVTVRNESPGPINVQTRIFRWSQTGGLEKLEPTQDVVVSPPILNLQPGVDNIVRVVRTAGQPVAEEESYRLVIDELPDTRQRRPGTIMLLVRHSIPVFFASSATEPARVSWSTTQTNNRLTLTATNAGASRLRLSELVIKNQQGTSVMQNAGLVGYVLGRSVMRWTFPVSRASATGPLDITALGENGPIHAKAVPAAGR